jgi:5-methylcytosine-specific restriction endonuclease McrA
MLGYNRYQSSKWKEITRIVRNRDGNMCQDCGRRIWGKDSHVHHIDHNPQNNELNNLILLCPDCHGKRHGRYLRMRERKPSMTLYDFP